MHKTIRTRMLSGTPDLAPRPYEAPHRAVARRAAAEGIVLLKNESGLLPLARGSKLALFGAGAGRTIKGGTGSGDVNERASVSIREGLAAAGFQITTDQWLDSYEQQYTQARLDWKQAIAEDAARMEAEGVFNAFWESYSRHAFFAPAGSAVYKTEADTAVYVIARIAGENADRFAAAGDYYISEEEHRHLADLCALYAHVVVLVNAGGVMDLAFLEDLPAIQSLLVVSQPGMEGGNAVADVLCGAVNPSGKLTDSWAMDYKDYPNAATFSHNNGDVHKELYTEGIYVGYRYFDSFELPVRYGFGFGGSYTTFALGTPAVRCGKMGQVTVEAAVTNTGAVAGRQVVQVYAGLPDGKLEKEARRLVAFAKTGTLEPGASETLTLTFGPEELESYDESQSAWLLEQGVYGVYVGFSLAESQLAASLVLESDKVLCRTEDICPLQQPLETLSLDAARRAARYEAMKQQAAGLPQLAYDLSDIATRMVDYRLEEPADEAAQLVDTLTDEQLVRLAAGEPSRGQGAEETDDENGSALGSAGFTVPGSAAETSCAALEQGVASLVLADGPAGLRLTQTYYVKGGQPQPTPMAMNLEHGFFYDGPVPEGEPWHQFCTAVPVGTLLAQTWDLDLLREIGSLVGEEMEIFGVQLWLAPGMNIHRNPLCGRNFEYFAEDPLLSGKCAAAITQGVQSHPGLGTTIKHYACNNQEDNRMASDSILTQRTLREIYLKGFEIAIRESHPLAMMTSYNLINGVHAANCYDICTKAAQCEFGFDGLIMTDWTTTNVDSSCTASGCVRAGNDVVMPGLPMDLDDLRAALADGSMSRQQLKTCITRLVRVILRSNRYE